MTWLTAVASIGGAIATDAVAGAAAGALIGAGTAAVKGNDIGDGALAGAMYGGAAGAVGGAVNQAFAPKLSTLGTGTGYTDAAPTLSSKAYSGIKGLLSTPANAKDPKSPLTVTDGTKNLAAGMVKGVADAYRTYSSNKSAEKIARDQIKANRELAILNADLAQDRVAANQPGDMNTQSPEIKRDDIAAWLEEYRAKNQLEAIEEAQYVS